MPVTTTSASPHSSSPGNRFSSSEISSSPAVSVCCCSQQAPAIVGSGGGYRACLAVGDVADHLHCEFCKKASPPAVAAKLGSSTLRHVSGRSFQMVTPGALVTAAGRQNGQRSSQEGLNQQKHNPVFVQPPPDCLLCPLCKCLLNQPVQTGCGHRFCSSCVDKLFQNPSPSCPVDHLPLDKNEVFRDIFAEREIRSLQVYCNLRKSRNDGVQCTWKGELQELQVHEAICSFAMVTCPNTGCHEVFQRQKLADHLRNSRSYRTILCLHCCVKVTANELEQHNPECFGGDLQQQRTALSKRCGISHGSDDCEHDEDDLFCNCKVACQFCRKLVPQISKKDHENICPECPTWCPNGCESKQLLRRELAVHAQVCPKQVVKCSYHVYGCNYQGLRCDLPQHDKAKQDYHLHLFFKLASRNHETNKSLVKQNSILSEKCAQLEQQVSHLERLSTVDRSVALHNIQLSETVIRLDLQDIKMSNGVLVWKISDFQRHQQEAISGKTPSMYSPPFYTSPAGYKVCARLYPNGDGVGRGTHLSFFFVVMKGEFDALLPWPFHRKVSLMLLDQHRSNNRHIIETFRPDPSSSSFQRPKQDMNVASGCPLFVPMSTLNESSYLLGGTLCLKVIVHPDSPQSPEKS